MRYSKITVSNWAAVSVASLAIKAIRSALAPKLPGPPGRIIVGN